MINNLEITNGLLELKFDKYTYEYTVIVDSEIDHLDFLYDVSSDTAVSIRDNFLDAFENIVYFDLIKDNSTTTYTFLVYKEEVESTSKIANFTKSLEVEKEEVVALYKVQILSVTLFLIIIVIFSLMFHRKKVSFKNNL